MSRPFRIGTRDSQLALWQANLVKDLLEKNGVQAELVPVKSEGDIDLTTPLYEMGVQGIFTKTLDIALLKGEIDIAVHSMKDVPTQLAKGLVQAAVLPRADHEDVLVLNDALENNSCDERIGGATVPELADESLVIATSSVRRRAQWLNRYPEHRLESLRGNVNTRLKKVSESNWNGAIFAKAGLARIGILPANAIQLNWMLPAPAQGAIVVVAKADASTILNELQKFNDPATALCTKIERDFLRSLMGGCTTPISALARIDGNYLRFVGQLMSLDGREKIEVEKTININLAEDVGIIAAQEILQKGGHAIIQNIKSIG